MLTVLVLTNELLIMCINKPDEFLQEYTILCNYQITGQAQLRHDLHYRDYRYSE